MTSDSQTPRNQNSSARRPCGAEHLPGQTFDVAMAKKKKKGRGKDKRATKKAEQKQEAATQQGTPDLKKLERLKIEDNSKDEDALLDEAIKHAAAETKDRIGNVFAKKHSNSCYHGYAETGDRFIIEDFSKAFFAGFISPGVANLGVS